MKTFTIGWLNKCRCGNKSHTVKTARGNNAGLWDDDAVKCNSCGRGGVIQVCEGQARVLWETDEEMAEGKPMSTITRERLEQLANFRGAPVTRQEEQELARIALASLEAEPVPEWTNKQCLEFLSIAFRHAEINGDLQLDDIRLGVKMVNGSRAAMLQGAERVTTAYKLPEGWVAVPVEPTEDMIVNGFESEPDESFSDEKEWATYDAMSGCQQAAHRAKLCWAAMIAAAPKTEHK